MSTDLAVRESRPTVDQWTAAPPQVTPAGALIEWGQALAAAGHMADLLCDTEFVPRQWRGKKAECAAAIMTGAALGMDPLAALRAMDSIQGTPAFRANTIRGLVQAHGHEIWVEEANSSRAIVKGRRRGSSHIETSMWDLDRARALGLVGKDNWKKQPQVMLVARGTTEIGRLVAADVLLGMAYSAEELDDGGDLEPPAEPIQASPAKRTARRAVVPAKTSPAAATPEPDFDPEPDPVAAPTADLITTPQRRKLAVLFRDAELEDRETCLAYVSEIIGHPVSSSTELTKAEASQVIDALEFELAQGSPVVSEQDDTQPSTE